MKKQVRIDEDIYKLWLGEANEIHALMDAGQVPREFDGQKLSLAQRVRWFYETREAASAALEKAGNAHATH